MNKKRYLIIIILIIFIFLSLFTFANPFKDGDGNNNSNEVEENEKDKVNQAEKEETKDEEKETIPTIVDDKSYEFALAAVIKAELTLEKDNYNTALDLVNKVTDNDKKKSLEGRLEKVLNYINVKELVEKLVIMTKESNNKEQLDDARKFNSDNKIFDKVEELKNDILKETLSKSLKEILPLLDDITIPTINIEDGAILNSDTKIVVEDENEVKILLNGTEIENNYDVSDGKYELIVTDIAFNEVKVNFIIDTTEPTATLKYSNDELTNEDVVVTLNPSEDVKVTNNDGKLEYTFKENGEFTFEFVDVAGNKGTTTAKVDYIDKKTPKATVAYSNEKLTNENVIVKITLSEEVKEVEGFTLSENKMVLVKELSANEEETIDVYDLAGNKITIDYSVKNIDKILPVATITYSTKEFINGNVTVTIEVTEEIKEVEGWNLSTNKKVLTKEFTENGEGTIDVYDLAGNKITVDYNVKNIDKLFPTIKGVEDGKYYKEATPIIEDENIESIKINGVNFVSGKTIKINGTFTLVATDKAGNETSVTFTVDNIEPKILVLDRLSIIRGDLIPIKPVIIDANLDTVIITLDGEDINYKDGDQLVEPGVYEITATDKAGNSSTTTFTMDNNGPEIYTEQEILGEKVDVKLSGISLGQLLAFKEVNLKVREDNFDPKSIIVLRKSSISLPFDFSLPTYNKIDYTYGDTITVEGEYIVLAADKALNISYAKFTIDRTKPVIVGVENGKYYNEAEVKVEDSNLALTVVSKKVLGFYVPTLLTNGDLITESGEYKIEASDAAGNTADPVEFIVDNENPTITGVTNNYIYTKEVTPVVKDSNLDSVVVTKDGNTIELQNKYSENGVYTITATDKANNSIIVSFEIDKDALNVDGIENNKYYQTEVTPIITNRGEITIKLMKDGSLVDYTSTISDEGEYALKVVDEYNNEVVVNFVIDKTPAIIYAESKQVPASKNSFISVEALVEDNIDEDKTIVPAIITHSSNNQVTLVDNKISTSKEWLGTYTLVYETTDEAGNESTKPITIEVLRADIVIVFDDTNVSSSVYNAENQLSTITAHLEDEDGNLITSNEGDIFFTVTDLNDNATTLENAGKYIITANVNKETTGYQYVLPVTMNYEITPKEVTIEYEAKESSLIQNLYEYDGTKKTYIAKVQEIDNLVTLGEVSTGVNVGTYELDASSLYLNPNYKLSDNNTLTVEITKAILRVDFPSKENINSDGTITPIFKNVSGKILTGISYTIEYKKSTGLFTSEIKSNMKEAGFYTVTVSVNNTDDYMTSDILTSMIYNI